MYWNFSSSTSGNIPMFTAFFMLMPLPMPPATYTRSMHSGVMSTDLSSVSMAEKIAPFARMKLSMSTSLMDTSRLVSDSSEVAMM